MPSGELLGDMYLELGRHDEALTAYEAVLERLPNRFNSLYGAARAAELSGSPEKAKEHYGKLVEMTSAESTRSEVEQARAFLASVVPETLEKRPNGA